MPARRISAALLALAFVFYRPALLPAALIAYEGFDYGPAGSDLLSKGGAGSGFSTPWVTGGFNASSFTNYDIASGSLSFGALQTSGNRTSTDFTNNIAGLSRFLSTPLGNVGTTNYVSFLLRPEGTLGNGVFSGFFGVILEQPAEPEFFFGKPGSNNPWVLENRGGSSQVFMSTFPSVNQTVLVVLKVQFAAGSDTITAYMNPTPGGLEPASGTVKNNADIGNPTALTIYSSGAFSIDELRLGATFADVTPVPEPSTLGLALAALAALALVSRRQRMRSQ